jgi:hypothetical protein
MGNIFHELNDEKILELYGRILDELKRRKLIRTNNLVGDWGERLAIKYYNENPDLPNLKAVNVGTKCVDAINEDNERYSIKSVTTNITGVFNGLNEKNSTLHQEKLFEYVIIVYFNKNFTIKSIYELNWESFLLLKKWNPSKHTWYLSISKKLVKKAKNLYVT